MSTTATEKYMTEAECERLHEERNRLDSEKEAKYREIIRTSMQDRENLWKEKKELATNLENYKAAINGKFNSIFKGIILILLTVVASLIGTIYTQMNTRSEVDSKIRNIEVSRYTDHHANQSHTDDLQKVIDKLTSLEKKLGGTR